MNVLFVSSEITPFASTGGLADVAGALPAALAREGAKVTRIMPLYRRVAENPKIRRVDTGLTFSVPLGPELRKVRIWHAPRPQPDTYFVAYEEGFDREHIYGLPDRDYADNFQRFLVFLKAVVRFIDHGHRPRPDIVHANDWPTGMLPWLLRHGVDGTGRTGTEATVFTIHNLAYQGLFDAANLGAANLPGGLFSMHSFEYYGKINCMKAGIVGADLVTTVSPTYAEEILTPERGCGLDGVLRGLPRPVLGIVNGVDYRVWSPSRDPDLPARYSARDLAGKAVCKQAVLEEMGFAEADGVPLVAMVSRLVDQKGFDLVARAMPELMKRDLRLMVLGTGQSKYHRLCQSWQRRWPEKFRARLEFDPALAHRMEAGADLFLMPSRFEPCGLNQIYSLRYGTVPVVHATGGLEDTIEDLTRHPESGTGFKFRAYTARKLLDAVDRALGLAADAKALDTVRRRIMRVDYSWKRSAQEYIQAYRSVARTYRVAAGW